MSDSKRVINRISLACAAVSLLGFSSCPGNFPSYSGEYGFVSDNLAKSFKPEWAKNIKIQFPKKLEISQYTMTFSKDNPVRISVGSLDPDLTGVLPLKMELNNNGQATTQLMNTALVADFASDDYFINGHNAGPSCVFNYRAEGIIEMYPSVDTLMKVYPQVAVEGNTGSIPWDRTQIQEQYWPDDVGIIVRIRFVRELAFNYLGVCSYEGRYLPQTVDRIEFVANYRRGPAPLVLDPRSEFSDAEVTSQLLKKVGSEENLWKKILNTNESSFQLPKYFDPPRFP